MKIQTNKKLLIIFIFFIVVSISAQNTDRGFFPFGFYDEIQDKSGLSLSLNYGFLDRPYFYGNYDKNWKLVITDYFSSIKLNYGIFNWLTISPQIFSYSHQVLYFDYCMGSALSGYKNGDNSLSLSFDLIISYNRYFYSIIDSFYFLGKNIFKPFFFGKGLNLGIVLYNIDKFLLTLEIDGGILIGGFYSIWLGGRYKISEKIYIIGDIKGTVSCIGPIIGGAWTDMWLHSSISISYRLFDKLQLMLGLNYALADLEYHEKITKTYFHIAIKGSIL